MARYTARDRSWLPPCFDKLVVTLLIYSNLVLAGYAGAGLATAARLRYDPTTYIVAREIFPEDFELTSSALPSASAGLLALAHFAVLALAMPRALRFLMLLLYAVVMLGMVGVEVWVAQQAWADVNSHIREGQRRLDVTLWHLQLVLNIVGSMNHYAWKLQYIFWELERDVPINLSVMWRAFVAFVGFQASAGVLAVLAALCSLRRARPSR